jgi:glutathione S-transferase
MDLYFAPLSCSMASRIALYEAGIHAGYHQVTLATKRLADGTDYLKINPMGQVPALKLDDGDVLTEGPAVLQYIADLKPDAKLAPPAGTRARTTLQQWLSFIGTEVHKGVFAMIFNPSSPPEAKAFARDVVLPARYDRLSTHLNGRDFLLDEGFSVADAYLVTTLNWAGPAGVDLSKWPVLQAYAQRLSQRPSVARAVKEELALRPAA